MAGGKTYRDIAQIAQLLQVGDGAAAARFTPGSDALSLAKTLIVEGFGGSVVSVAADHVLTTEYVLLVDASGAPRTIDLPALAMSLGRVFKVQKIDASANPVVMDPNGGETINGAATFSILGSGDTLEVANGTTDWRITQFLNGGSLVQSDPLQVLALDRSSADFAGAPTAAEARTTVNPSVVGFREVDCIVELDTNPTITEMRVQVRFSGQAAPDIAVPTDWSPIRADDIDLSNGESATVEYTAKIAVTPGGPSRFTISLPVREGIVSALVWGAAGAVTGSRGNVFFQRRA